MNVKEYLKTIPAEEESIKQEASIYRGMKLAGNLLVKICKPEFFFIFLATL